MIIAACTHARDSAHARTRDIILTCCSSSSRGCGKVEKHNFLT
nr:MAG TPA: hypothetical protein [Microviridae sp.]